MSLVAFLLLPAVKSAEIVLVEIAYAERPGPQGSYVLAEQNGGLFSLDPIFASEEGLADVKADGIGPALEKAFPHLEGKITVLPIKAEAGKLAAAGKVHVMGEVENAGDYPVTSLDACMAEAKPTEFGAIMRIQVIRKQKSHLYNLKKIDEAAKKLEAGDIVLVPQKKIIGQ